MDEEVDGRFTLRRSWSVFAVLVSRLPIMAVRLDRAVVSCLVDWLTRLVAYVSELSPQSACASSITGPILSFPLGHSLSHCFSALCAMTIR